MRLREDMRRDHRWDVTGEELNCLESILGAEGFFLLGATVGSHPMSERVPIHK